jgi:hypothetical protein
MIAALLVGGFALWLLGDDDQPPPPEDATASAPIQRPTARPSHRTPAPSYDYPAAAAPQPYRETTPWGSRRQDPEFAPFDSPPWDRGQANAWPGGNVDTYRFRPLTERERQRMGSPEALSYRPSATAAPGYAAGPPIGSWSQGDYRNRTYAPGPNDNARYPRDERIYPWEAEPDYADRWDQPPSSRPRQPRQPEWQPPSHRMYPSLDWTSDRTLTAR